MLGQITHILVAALGAIVGFVLLILVWIETNLGAAMTAGGVPHQLQTLLEIIIAVLFLVLAVRLFSGFIRLVLIFVLLSIVAHAVTTHVPLHPTGAMTHA